MVKAVIFDVGGVLIRTPDRRSRLKWEERLNLREWESEEIVFSSEMGTRAQRGEITDEELWTWVGQRLRLTPDQLIAFRRDFWAGDVLDTRLVDFIRGLRPAYQTAIISNATDRLHHNLTVHYPIADAFDLIVNSAEENVMKPDPTIYRLALTRLGRSPEEVVFVDDNQENVDAAQQEGMQAIHFYPQLDIIDRLTQLGVS